MALRDYVIQTSPSREGVAHGNLCAQGFDIYYPTIIIERSTRGRRYTVMEPLFPSYIFARFDIDEKRWRSINGTRGVMAILGTNPERPTPMPMGSLEIIKMRFAAGEFAVPKTRAIIAGEKVAIVRGAFEGHTGLCMKSRGERVKILLSILSGSVEVSINATDVARSIA